MEALESFLVKGPDQDPQPLPYLQDTQPRNYDITLKVQVKRIYFILFLFLSSQDQNKIKIIESKMTNNEANGSQHFKTVTVSNFKYLYWSMKQQLAHHTVGGCNLRTGDLLGSGTISGPVGINSFSNFNFMANTYLQQ